MKCLLPLLWLRNERCKSGIKLEFLSPIFGSPEVMRKGDGMKSFQSRETQMTFLKNFPSTQTPVQNKFQAWDSADSSQ